MRSTQSMSITFFLWHFETGGFYWARRITLEIVRVGVTSGNLFSSWTTCYQPLNMLPLLAIPLSELFFESCCILSGECGHSFSFGWWQTLFFCFLFGTHCVYLVMPAGTQDWPGFDLTQVLCRGPQLQWGSKDNSHAMCRRQHPTALSCSGSTLFPHPPLHDVSSIFFWKLCSIIFIKVTFHFTMSNV